MDATRTGDQTSPPAPPARPARGRSIAFQLAALGLTLVSALAGTGLARWLRAPVGVQQTPAPAVKFPARLFSDWKTKPDLVLVLSGQMHGYILPCGCSRPQVGGLERRYNLLQLFKQAGWPYVAMDLGDLTQKHGPASLPNQQALIKHTYSMRALKLMDYTAVGFGETEVNQGLLNVFAEYALQDPKPRVVSGNLIDADKNFPEMTAPWTMTTPAGTTVTVGVTSIVGPTAAARMKELARGNNTVRFERTPDALDRIVKQMTLQKVELPVLLYQGPISRNNFARPYTEAMACAEAYPQFPLVVCATSDDEPPARPTEVTNRAGGKSLLISLGHKGKFIGVVGVWKTGNPARPFDFRYERVELTEDFLTAAKDEKDHPVAELMETYTRELKSQNYLARYGQVRHALQVMPEVPGLDKKVAVEYVGSQACKSCHKKSHEIWKKSPHSHAYQTLVDANRPSNRQFDPECIVCHVVGFGQLSGFVSEEKTPHLKDVGCESCHGPSSVHVANPYDTDWHKRINPWKYLPAKDREGAIDQFCQKCHDMDNDVTWLHNGFKRKWPKIEHKESE